MAIHVIVAIVVAIAVTLSVGRIFRKRRDDDD